MNFIPPGLILAPPRLTSGYESAPPWDRTPKSASARRPPRTSSGTKGYAMKHVTAAKVELSRARVAVVRPASSLTCRSWSAGARFAGSGSAGLLLRYPGPAGLPWPFFWPAGLAVGGAACFHVRAELAEIAVELARETDGAGDARQPR